MSCFLGKGIESSQAQGETTLKGATCGLWEWCSEQKNLFHSSQHWRPVLVLENCRLPRSTQVSRVCENRFGEFLVGYS